MTDLMEWIIIFFVLYTFCSVWLISNMLENILKILKDMNEKK